MNNYAVGVAGFRGYSGVELQAILERHPGVTPVLLEHGSPSEIRPKPRKRNEHVRLPCSPESVNEANLAVVFLCTPADVSLDLAPKLLAAGARVVDLSGAFRLRTLENYARWYKEPHNQPELLASAVYGLPEFYRDRIPAAQLLSNPGCYPTAANLAIRPLVQSGKLDLGAGIVCDAKSGVSGAGRKPSLKTSFCEVTENFSAYSILDHRHVPEVLQHSGLEEPQFSFTAQLIPIHRGILETIYFRAPGLTGAALVELYEEQYASEPFIRLYSHGEVPDLAAVNHTNFCDIGVRYDSATGRGVVVSAIDNLIKGAAGQAVQNMNLMLGFPETQGLL